MSKDGTDTYLKFGQGILIQGYKSDHNVGLLTSKGFADTKANYETYDDILYFKNYRNAIFQILPASNFQINDQLRKAKDKPNADQANLDDTLEGKAKSEGDQFAIAIKNKYKQVVQFGMSVIFRHVDSQTYLSGTIFPSEGSNGAFTVEVSKNLSQALIFKLQQFRSFEFEGMPIPFDSPIKIKNQYNGGYLTFELLNCGRENQRQNNLFQKKVFQGDDSYKIPVKTKSLKSDEYEGVTYFVDLSEEKEVPMPWKFVFHVSEIENDSLIQHDIVYLQHTQKQGVLSASGDKIILKELKGQGSSELSFYQCLWEIEKHQGKDQYILRHLMSGMTLGIQYAQDQQGNSYPAYPKLIDISDGKEVEIGVIELKMAKKEGGQINSQSFVNICWGQYCIDIKKQQGGRNEHQIHDVDQRSDPRISKQRLKTLALNEVQYVQKQLQFTMNISKHCFTIMEIEKDLKKELLFALSFHCRIIKLRDDLKYGEKQATKKVGYQRMMQVTEKIRQIKDFLKNCQGALANEQYVQPIYKRQMICKDLGVSELLFQLLYYMKANQKESIFKQMHNQKTKFIQLYNTCYEVIIELIRNNYMFKVHVSKWILFIIDDVVQSNDECRLKALKQLLKDNTFLVNNFISDELIKDITVKMIDVPADKRGNTFHQIKFIQILRSFCIVGDRVNTENQIKILNHFVKYLRNSPNGFVYLINIRKQGEDIIVDANIDKNIDKNIVSSQSRTFQQYYQLCKTSYPTAWEYFISFMNLMADMTQGRNKIVQKSMQIMFPVDVLTMMLRNHKLYEAYVPIIRLVHYLFIQNEKYYPIQRQRRIIDYNDIQKQQITLNCTQAQQKPWEAEPLNIIIETMLDKIQQYTYIYPKQYKQNQCLFELLNLIYQTLNLGLYNSQQKLKAILEYVLKILEPPPQFKLGPQDTTEVYDKQKIQNQSQQQFFYRKCSLESKQNILMNKCKLGCLKIIQCILDYDQDLCVQRICQKFKTFQFPLKKPHLSENNTFEIPADMAFALDFIKQFDSQEIKPILDQTICQKMFQLSKYNNPELTSQSISIIQRVANSKKTVFDKFSNEIFLCDTQRLQLYKYISLRKNKFFLLSDQNTIRCKPDSQDSNYFYVERQSSEVNLSGIMQDMHMICQLIKNENSINRQQAIATLQTSNLYNQLASDKLINFTCERASSNNMKQRIINASRLHHKVVQYVLNCKQIPQEEFPLKLLHLCYRFLVSLIENYQDVKLQLIPYLNQIRHHIKKNIGCIDFMKQIYDNNKNMLYNQADIIQVTRQICQTIEQLDVYQSFYKSKLFDFFRYLIYCNEKALKNNQILILKVMQDDDFKSIFIQDSAQFITNLVNQYDRDYEEMIQNHHNIVKRSSLLVYTETFFQIMGCLIDGNNNVNIGKMIKRFPFDNLVEYVTIAGRCWSLKRNIRSFLNRIYYFQPEIQTYMKTIIGSQLQNIINDLNSFIQIKCSSDVEYYQEQMYQNPVRFSYLESYLYLNLQQNLLTLYQMVTKPKLHQQIKNYFKSCLKQQDCYQLIRICQRLGFIKSYFNSKKNIYTSSLIKFLLSRFCNIILEFDQRVLAKGMIRIRGQEGKIQLVKKIMGGQIAEFYQKGLNKYKNKMPLTFLLPEKDVMIQQSHKMNREQLMKKLRIILTRTKRDFNNLDEQVQYKMQKLISSIKLSPDVNLQFEVSYWSKMIDYVSPKNQKIFDYIQMIIKMNSEALPVQLKIFFLQMITGMVEKTNKTQMKQKKLLDQWEAAEWVTYQKDIKQLQLQLRNRNLGKLLIELFKENIVGNIAFANELLLCGIAFLYGGCSENQANIIQTLRQNDHDNKVMNNIQQLIAKLGEFIRKNISQGTIKQQIQLDIFSVSTIDNYDYYDSKAKYCSRKNVFEPNSTNQQLYRRLCIITYRRSFKFLQLLCENNNVEGKHFIRQQPFRSVNFISITTKELRSLFEAMCAQIVTVPSFLMDFLLEVTQIPVKENQQALMSSTFFQDLCQMQSNFNKEGFLTIRRFNDSEAIEQFYFKAVQIILSNFQGNQMNTYTQLSNKLQPRFLINVLQGRLKKMNIGSKAELQNYIEESSKQTDENGNVIIKNTFSDNMMSILSIITVFMKMKKRYQEHNQKLQEKQKLESHVLQHYNKSKNDNEDLYNALQGLLLNIQITDSNGVNQTIYFAKFPVFNSLTAGLRDYVMTQVSRNTHRDKIISLLGYIPDIKDAINTSYQLQKTEGIVEKHLQDNYQNACTTSIIICIYMIMFYEVMIQYGAANFLSDTAHGLIRFALSLIQLYFTLNYSYYWFRLKIWYTPTSKPKSTSQEKVEQPKQQDVKVVEVSSIKRYYNTAIQKIKQLIRYDQLMSLFYPEDDQQRFYLKGSFARLFIFVLISFVGTFYNPTFFFIHIIDKFCMSPVLSNIIQAIAYSGAQLFILSVMGVVFTLVFCTVTFSNYLKNVYSESDPVDDMCEGMISCVVKLYISGVINETMQQFETVRFIFDMIHVTFFGLLFSNIVSGILIDTFSSLRDQNETLADDKENLCYICNIKRENVEKQGLSFQQHVTSKHFLWNYVFYIYCLEEKNPTDYTGLEYDISTKYNKPDQEIDVSWIPLGEQVSFDSLQKIKTLSAYLVQAKDTMSTKVQQIDQKIGQFASIAEQYEKQ